MPLSHQWQLDAGIPRGHLVNISEVALAMGQTDGRITAHNNDNEEFTQERQVSRLQNADKNN